MSSKTKVKKKSPVKKLSVKVSQHDFNRHIKPFLKKPVKGPRPKSSYYKIFNYILYVLHTGIQWKQLKVRSGEGSWQNIYHYHNRWSKDGSYRRLFESSILLLDRKGMLDLSVLHGDGSNTVAKKGVRKSDIRGTSTRRERKRLR
jgi:transposase